MYLFLQLSNAYLGSEKRVMEKCSVFVTNLLSLFCITEETKGREEAERRASKTHGEETKGNAENGQRI